MSTKEFPKHLTSMIGKENTYEDNGKKLTGIVLGLRWTSSWVEDMKTGERWYGFQALIKPLTGTKARWTKTLNSGIKIGKP